MYNNERDLFTAALEEIKSLRASNHDMRLRLDMFDDLMSALHGQPGTNKGGAMHPDIAYEIQKYLDTHPTKPSEFV